MSTVKIGTREVGVGLPAYIIAEAGANHDRDLDVAHKLIDVAADAQADAVKFQTYSAEKLYSRKTPRLSEMDDFGRSPDGETPFELIKRIELPREWQSELFSHATERNLDFLSTPFDLEAARELEELGVKAHKISSYEIRFYDLIALCARSGKPVIVSTGNSDLADVERAVREVQAAGDERLILLHCVSQYPASYLDLNLRAMKTLESAFEVPVGFSDHTMDDTAAIVAVALGASCLERHFTLSRERKGPDHPSAAEPDELKRYVEAIRNAEASLGSGIKRVQPSEEENHQFAQRSLHAAMDIAKGSEISMEMLAVKRPGLGIHPMHRDVVLGKRASRDIEGDEWITWEMVS